MKTLLLPLLALAASLASALELASPFGDHMVLQRDHPLPIWGSAQPGETVTVEFAGQTAAATADSDGRWRATLPPLPASAEPRLLAIRASASSKSLALSDVLVGEVWLCGGQSNMERQLGPRPPQPEIIGWREHAARANSPLIRELHVAQTRAATTQSAVEARWTVCTPETVLDFSAVGYFFARDLHAKLGVPVGIIHSSWGGTPAETWTSAEGLAPFPEFDQDIAALRQRATDPEGAARAHAIKLDLWYQANDPGTATSQPWQSPTLDTAAWQSMPLPAAWEDLGHPGFDGVAWMRKSFDLPPSWQGRELILRLGAIDDADTTWVNGVKIGSTNGWSTPRIYRVPASALRPTGNVFAVRVLDTGGNGGIWNPQQPLDIAPADAPAESLSLKGPWLARFGPPLTGADRPPTDGSNSWGTPTALFNGMIAPLAPYAIRGAAFYQGESNAANPDQYRRLFPAMIADWRRLWQQGDFPFLFVQVAPFQNMPPEIREAQQLAGQATPNTAMVATIDVGDPNDIHPANKEPVGARLALAARAIAYGEKIVHSGPVFRNATFDGPQATLHFDHLGGGLVAQGGPLRGFTLAADNGIHRPAQAEIVGDAIVLTAPGIPLAAAARYGWANAPSANLFNAAGLPAPPFRTDAPSLPADFRSWAPTPPMGWNSWDNFATTITEDQTKAQADYMAAHLKAHGWQYIVVDIQWYEPGAQSHAYRSDAVLAMDAFGRLQPAPNRFPSAADGSGFKTLAAYVHDLGLKFGVHLMRGIPRQAVEKNLPVFGANVRAQDIANTASICPWNPDMYGVDMSKPGAQAYYDSVFALFAEWGVDYVKVDDISRPYHEHEAEIEAIRRAIDKTGRSMVLSLSPGETALSAAPHAAQHANLWRISDDFWDRWLAVREQFTRLANWNPLRRVGAWPDADMLPFGVLELGKRSTRFTKDEQRTVMTLWSIARSPLMHGGDLTLTDPFTLSLLTNHEVIAVNQRSSGNRPLFENDDLVAWVADVPDSSNGEKYLAVFNARDRVRLGPDHADFASPFLQPDPAAATPIDLHLAGGQQLFLCAEGNGQALWTNPRIHFSNGSSRPLADFKWSHADALWDSASIRPDASTLAAQAPARVIYEIPPGAARFTATAVVENRGYHGEAIRFLATVGRPANTDPRSAVPIPIDLASLGFDGPVQIRDLWTATDLGVHTGSFAPEIPFHGAGLYRLTPTSPAP